MSYIEGAKTRRERRELQNFPCDYFAPPMFTKLIKMAFGLEGKVPIDLIIKSEKG